MTRRRWTALALVLAAVCVLLGFAGAGRAAADGTKVQVSVDGRGFTSAPRGPLLRTATLAPGVTARAQFGVRSGFDSGTGLALTMVDVADDDNGCAPPEAAVDSGCGAGQGELGSVLQAAVSVAAQRDGPYTPAWSGSVTQLVAGVETAVRVPSHGDRWLRLTLTVPASAGNDIETDTFGFGLRVTLQADGSGGSGGSGVDAATIHRGDGTEDTAGHGLAGLAATGVSTVLFLTGGVLLVVAGTLLALGARDRRATASGGSSTARRASRRAAAR